MQPDSGDKKPMQPLTRQAMGCLVVIVIGAAFVVYLFGRWLYNEGIARSNANDPYQYQVKADCSGLAVINLADGPQTIRFNKPGMSRMASLNKVRWLSVSAIPDTEGCKVTSYIVRSGEILAEKSTTSSASAAKVSFQAP